VIWGARTFGWTPEQVRNEATLRDLRLLVEASKTVGGR
jgi:hypothetical protein